MAAIAAIVGATIHHYWNRIDSGDPAPDIELRDASGQHVRLGDYAGKFILLHFWATWCDTCRAETPSLERFYNRFKNDARLVILAVSEDEGRNVPEKIEGFREKTPFTFPVFLDPKGNAANAFQTLGVPETILIGSDGTVIGRMTGAQQWETPETLALFEQLVARLPMQESKTP